MCILWFLWHGHGNELKCEDFYRTASRRVFRRWRSSRLLRRPTTYHRTNGSNFLRKRTNVGMRQQQQQEEEKEVEVWMDGWVPNLNEMVGRVIRPNIWLSTETVLTDAISAKLCKIRFLNGPCPDSFSYIFVFSNKHYNFYSKYVWRNDHPI